MKPLYFVPILAVLCIVPVGFVNAQTDAIPSWVKPIAIHWGEDKLSDAEFIEAIEFLIGAGIIVMPSDSTDTNPTPKPERPGIIVMPSDSTDTAPITPTIIADTFGSSLDSWSYKEISDTKHISTYCGLETETNAYLLSHSTEDGGSAHISNTNKCWFGWAGAAKSFDFPANYNTLEIDLDYRSLAGVFPGIGQVNNVQVTVTDSSGTVIHTAEMYRGAESSGLTDTAWQDYTVSVFDISSSDCPCEIFVHLRDGWLAQWHQKFYMDNVTLRAANTAS